MLLLLKMSPRSSAAAPRAFAARSRHAGLPFWEFRFFGVTAAAFRALCMKPTVFVCDSVAWVRCSPFFEVVESQGSWLRSSGPLTGCCSVLALRPVGKVMVSSLWKLGTRNTLEAARHGFLNFKTGLSLSHLPEKGGRLQT